MAPYSVTKPQSVKKQEIILMNLNKNCKHMQFMYIYIIFLQESFISYLGLNGHIQFSLSVFILESDTIAYNDLK